MPDILIIAAITAKFMLYVGVLTASGTVISALIFNLYNHRNCSLKYAFLGIFATIIDYLLRGANLTGHISGMFNPEMLALLWSTPVGTTFLYRIVGLSILSFSLFMSRVWLWLSGLGGIIALWSFVYSGHISSQDQSFLDIALILHLVFIAIWIGILTPLKQFAIKQETWPKAVSLGHRFGFLATITVPSLIVLGIYMGYKLVGSLNLLFNSSYGQVLILKVIIVAFVLLLAAINKLRLIPQLQANKPNAAQKLVKLISLEWLIILVILATTAFLTSNLTLPN